MCCQEHPPVHGSDAHISSARDLALYALYPPSLQRIVGVLGCGVQEAADDGSNSDDSSRPSSVVESTDGCLYKHRPDNHR